VAVQQKGPTVAVVVLDELIDATDQIFNTAEGSATNGSLGDQGKPTAARQENTKLSNPV
jgi:hypothetical protein